MATSRKTPLPAWLKLPAMLSLDVVAGAVGICIFLIVIQLGPMAAVEHWDLLLILGLAVWIIYTVDHAIDANVIGSRTLNKRQQFHQDYTNTLVFLGIIASIALIYLLSDGISEDLQLVGSIAAGLTLLRQVLAFWPNIYRNNLWLKFTITSAGYTSGVSAVPFSLLLRLGGVDFDIVLVSTILVFILAFSNMIMLELRELGRDVKLRYNLKLYFWLTWIASLTVGIILAFQVEEKIRYFVLANALGIIFLNAALFATSNDLEKERFRLYAELTLALPIPILVLGYVFN
jgi:hypothetical protein